MRKLLLICLIILLSNLAYSQSCKMSEEAQRYYNRAVTATKMAKSTDDHKAALAEYQKASGLCPDCSELYYRMGLCCEIIGEDDYAYYSSALKYFKKSLAVDPNLLEELKKLLQGKISAMEYAVEQAVAANKDTLIPANLCGRWTFHSSDGKTNDLYDITISENQGFYSAKFRIINQFVPDSDNTIPSSPTLTTDNNVDISFSGNTICFTTLHNKIIWNKQMNSQIYHSKRECNYELVLENGILKGVNKCSLNFEAMGHNDYRTVKKATDAGYGNILFNCSGNCGSSNVYFTR